MYTDYSAMEVITQERIASRYQDAENHRLANTVSDSRRERTTWLKGAGHVLSAVNRAIRATLVRTGQPVPVSHEP